MVDDDVVELSNLQRQVIHTSERIGRPKVESAARAVAAVNPGIRLVAHHTRLEAGNVDALIGDYQVVADGSDNFATRFAINAACVDTGTALVSGAAIRMEGQLSVFLPQRADSPCYRCLYSEGDEPDQSCTENGVLAPITGVIGSLQALEAIKVLLDIRSEEHTSELQSH